MCKPYVLLNAGNEADLQFSLKGNPQLTFTAFNTWGIKQKSVNIKHKRAIRTINVD